MTVLNKKIASKIFKIDAEGDTVYVNALTEDAAYIRLTEVMGEIPKSILKFSEVKKLPKGEEFI